MLEGVLLVNTYTSSVHGVRDSTYELALRVHHFVDCRELALAQQTLRGWEEGVFGDPSFEQQVR